MNRTRYVFNLRLDDKYRKNKNDNSEIRVAFQWRSQDGKENRRAIFYGKESLGNFREVRIDNYKYDNNNEFVHDNGFATSLPKHDPSLYEELTEVAYQTYLLSDWGHQNYVKDDGIGLVFYTNQDEPFGPNEISINWGVF